MSYDYKSILVTGGAGCIGMQVCAELRRRGAKVRLFDLPEQISRVREFIPEDVDIYYGSILDMSSLRDGMAGCDAVIHLAAYLGVMRTETNRLRCLDINMTGTRNVLDCAVQHRVEKIVFASSSEVYGEPVENPVRETTLTQGKTVYAVSKLAGEELCKAYSQRYPHLKHTVLRYFNAYGPYQITQFVIPKFVYNVQHDRPPIIYGTGEQMRSFCYSSDTARGTVDALYKPEADGQTINIGNSESLVSLKDLAKLVIEVGGKEGKIEAVINTEFSKTDREESREIHRRYCDTSLALNLLDFRPRVSLRDGIANVFSEGRLFDRWESSDIKYTLDEWIEDDGGNDR